MFTGVDKIEELKTLIDCYCTYPDSNVSDTAMSLRLKELLYFYDSILSCKTLKIMFLNPKGNIQYINKKTEKWLGYSRLEVDKKSVFKPHFLTSEGSNIFYLHFKEALAGTEVQPFTLGWLRKDGTPLTGQTFIVPITEEKEHVLSILVVIIDQQTSQPARFNSTKDEIQYGGVLHERMANLLETNNELLIRIEKFRAVESQMKDTLERIRLYESIINRSDSILFRWKIEPDWPIHFVSDNISAFGYTPGDFINGKVTWQDFIYSEDLESVRDRGKAYREEGQRSYTHTYRVVTKSGEIRWVSNRVEVINDSEGNDLYIQDVITDITKQKKLEEELARYRQHLEVLVETKTNQLKKANDELTQQKEELEHKNMLLTELLRQIEVEKKRIRDDVIFNIEKLLLPTIRHIELDMSTVNKNYKDLLEGTIRELSSSFGRKISDQSYNLSPRELEICNMIKNGLSSKEIAELVNISPQVVNWHRNNIRKKMGIVNKKINLTSYLKDM